MVAKLRLTPEIQKSICDFVQAGVPIPQACDAAGVSWNTVKDWLKKGREGKKPFDGFLAATQTAKAKWVAAATMRITKAGVTSWKADAWLLERRLPNQFGRAQHLEHSGSVGLSVRVVEADPRLEAMKDDPKKAAALKAFLDAIPDKE